MIAIVDYGVGNIFSLTCSFQQIGAEAVLTKDPAVLKKADKIVLPGVGAFEDAARKLRESGMQETVLEEAKAGKPLLGICLGMQLLFDKSYEYGEWPGLSLIPGNVVDMKPLLRDPSLKIPEIGWNALEFPADKPVHPLFRYVKEGDYVYFVHSFCAVDCDDSVIARTDYSFPVTAAVAKDNVMGFQFHPEKSGNVGLALLRAFSEL